MKSKSLACAFLLALIAGATHAQPFNSGSDGSYGALVITSNTTLNIPSNGIFNCTTITITNNATLTFSNNALNTPVYLLATGDVFIASGGINVSGTAANGFTPGSGGPGGFDGGWGGFGTGVDSTGGDGNGPGGGRPSISTFARDAVFANTSGSPNTNYYGNALCSPLIGGSGGGGGNGNPGTGGGGGGGALLIASTTKITLNGTLSANGGGGNGGGSGGSIRLVAPVVTGAGVLVANGGGGYYGGAAGRMRIDCTDKYAFRSIQQNLTTTRGAQMFVFPPAPIPRLDILSAAGTSITEGTGSSVAVNLPVGTSTNQSVTVQARDFTNAINIRISVVPENRPSTNYDATINMSSNPQSAVVPIVVPDGTVSRISVWTR